MQTKKKRRAPTKDPRAKLSKAARKAIDPPPVDRGDFEEVIRRLVAPTPKK